MRGVHERRTFGDLEVGVLLAMAAAVAASPAGHAVVLGSHGARKLGGSACAPASPLRLRGAGGAAGKPQLA